MKNMTAGLLVLGLVILLTGGFALAGKKMAISGGPAAPPQWMPIPQVPGVEYAPNIDQDLFRYQGGFYDFRGGAWYRAPIVNGPWEAVPQPPPVFYNIQAPYFKAPPGWAKGKKTGWRGAPLPPGQMKNQYRNPVD
jgi:hypothetical protein